MSQHAHRLPHEDLEDVIGNRRETIEFMQMMARSYVEQLRRSFVTCYVCLRPAFEHMDAGDGLTYSAADPIPHIFHSDVVGNRVTEPYFAPLLTLPRPGTAEALALGCPCTVEEVDRQESNLYAVGDTTTWRFACPVHGEAARQAAAEAPKPWGGA